MNGEKKYIQEITVLEGRGTKNEERCVYECHQDYSFSGLSLDDISNKLRMGELFVSFRCNEENISVRIDEIVKLHTYENQNYKEVEDSVRQTEA